MPSPPDDPGARDETQVSSSSSAPAPPRRARRAAPAPNDPVIAEAVVADDAPAPRRRSRARSSSTARTEAVTADPAEPRPRVRSRTRSVVAPPVEDLAPIDSQTDSSGAAGERRYRQTLIKVDLWSVTKLAVCFYLSAMFVTLVALVALWMIAQAAGIIGSIEKFFGDLLSAKDFHFISFDVLRGGILLGLVTVGLQVVITVIAASFYNIFAELFGGLEITVREEAPPAH